MAEPSSTAGITLGLGVTTLTGSIFGIHYDMLMAGVLGGCIALSYLPPMPRLRVAGTVATAALASGFFGPLLAAAGLHYFAWLTELGDFWRLVSGAAIGLTIHAILPAIPAVVRWLKAKWGVE